MSLPKRNEPETATVANFCIFSLFAFFSGFLFIYVVTKSDFPNRSTWEIVRYSLLPPIPAALICAAVGCRYVHRAQRVENQVNSDPPILVVGVICAIASVVVTIVGATALGFFGWASVK